MVPARRDADGDDGGKSGLAQRIAYTIAARIGNSYSRLLLGFIIVDFVLTFLVPSGIARVTILGAIAIGVVEAFGVGPKSNIGRGLFIIITYAATIFDKMLIAGAASILARGIIQEHGGVQVLYSLWFLAYLPCDLITIVVVLAPDPVDVPAREAAHRRQHADAEAARSARPVDRCGEEMRGCFC